MLLADIVASSAAVGATRSRLRKRAALVEALHTMSGSEIRTGVSYLSGELPQGRIGVGYAAVYAIDEEPAAQPELTVAEVDAAFTGIAGMSGRGSQRERHDALAALMGRATEPEQAFLRALLLRELRQGALETSMAEAIAEVIETGVEDVLRAIMLSGDLPGVAHAALTEGTPGLKRFRLTLFQPVRPMLARTAENVAGALDRHSPASIEAKLDGARVQLHKDGDRVAIYTRNLRDVTDNVPEIAADAAAFAAEAVILDGEVIALDEGGRPQPFQVTMSRFGRSIDVAEMQRSIPLSAFYFDCLHVDGEDLIDAPGSERWERLESVVTWESLPARIITSDVEEARRLYESVLESGHEGVMVKSVEATYSAGRRGSAWLKVKPAHTLDLVVLAVEWGSGRRKGWLSNLHLGARDPDTGGFVMLGKTFKGLTDEMLEWQTERFLELETHRERHVVYVRPEQVVETAFDGIQASSRYPGGMALRFARVKGYRRDKGPEEADTIRTVGDIFGRPPKLG